MKSPRPIWRWECDGIWLPAWSFKEGLIKQNVITEAEFDQGAASSLKRHFIFKDHKMLHTAGSPCICNPIGEASFPLACQVLGELLRNRCSFALRGCRNPKGAALPWGLCGVKLPGECFFFLSLSCPPILASCMAILEMWYDWTHAGWH